MTEYYLVSQMNGFLISSTATKELGMIVMNEFDKNKSAHQRWEFTSEGYLQLAGTQLVMDIDQQNDKPGAPVVSKIIFLFLDSMASEKSCKSKMEPNTRRIHSIPPQQSRFRY